MSVRGVSSMMIAAAAAMFIAVAALRLRTRPSATAAAQQTGSVPVAHAAQRRAKAENPLISVNYHFLRQCNYRCKFCFHTDDKSDVLTLPAAKKGLELLRDAGTEKINFSGGEPFLKAAMLGEMCRFAKRELGMSVTIISNGSLIRKEWLMKYGQFVDILGISCDSFDPETNRRIGRASRQGDHVDQLRRVCQWCKEYNIKFKMNTVVCAYNHEEDLSSLLRELCPARWKVFQCLEVKGENAGDNETGRNVQQLLVTDAQFQAFIARHATCHPVVEDNESMRNSYLILDEKMRFLNNRDGTKAPTASILEVGVPCALDAAGFDFTMFVRRGGIYSWTKDFPATRP